MKVFISQPMKDKTNDYIKKERCAAIKWAKRKLGDDIEVIDSFFIDSFFENAPHNARPLWFLGKSFELLSGADVALFIGEWEKYCGGKMEHAACEAYGIKTLCFSK